jgi:ABC-type dipeptide/oligopeptide/nickel transport system permease component
MGIYNCRYRGVLTVSAQICVFMTGILCGLKKAEKIKGEVFRGLTVLTIFFSTVFSFWFLDQVSGV